MPKKSKITLTLNELLEIFADFSWDRPSAYYALCTYARVRGDIPELSMHAKSRKYGWKGDSPEALAHIEKHFGRRNVSRLFSGEWDT